MSSEEAAEPDRSGIAPRRLHPAGIVVAPAAVWTTTVASPSAWSIGPWVVSTCCTRSIGTSVRVTRTVPCIRSISSSRTS